jgi:hypothetical protein
MSIFFDEQEEEMALRAEREAEIHQHELVGLLTSELSLIAGEIESLPVGVGDMTPEQIVALQKIDFCRQRLMEVTKIMNNAFGSSAVETLHDIEDILIDVGLEHTLDAFKRAG